MNERLLRLATRFRDELAELDRVAGRHIPYLPTIRDNGCELAGKADLDDRPSTGPFDWAQDGLPTSVGRGLPLVAGQAPGCGELRGGGDGVRGMIGARSGRRRGCLWIRDMQRCDVRLGRQWLNPR